MKNTTALLFALLIFSSVLTADEPWKLIKEADGIKVYSKMDKNSSIKIIKAEAEVKASLSAFVMLIEDVSNQHNWVFRSKNAKVLKVIDKNNWYFYSQTDAPWPVSDRDVITTVQVLQDSITKTVTILSNAIPDFIPKKMGFVRIPEMFASWVLKPLPNGKIHITFQIEINIGGIIPQWVTNLFIFRGPFNTLKNMLAEIKKPAYKNVKCPIIEEMVH